MKRRSFIEKLMKGAVTLTALPLMRTAEAGASSSSDSKTLGYNHLPNKEIRTMNTVLHKANTRGQADHGWLKSNHTFSFANYYNPERMNFGALRVLNDDHVSAGRGFGTHPHRNMEIISIPLEGDLEHQDSMGNKGVIRSGDIQVMSAGTGIQHSEYNKNQDKAVKFLQIWVLPNAHNVDPRYDQITLGESYKKNQLNQILSPVPDDAGVWIHQDAWFHMGEFEEDNSIEYKLKKGGNGVYLFLIEGEASVGETDLERRDGFGIWEVDDVKINVKKGTKILLMEVPM